MNLNSTRIDLKVFRIDRSYYEFRNKSSKEIIEIIKDNHTKKLRSKFDAGALINLNQKLVHAKEDEFEYWTYCFNQPKNQNYWKHFLPDDLTEGLNFNIVEFSFVLFIRHVNKLYCVIGGSGMSVIRKFVDPTFGIDVYQHFASPLEDVIVELNARGIASNISQKRHTFNLNQTISETLEYSEIPSKLKLVLRKELKNGLFKKYNLGSERLLLEVGAYFWIRKKINFDELKMLIHDLHTIESDDNYSQLTLFRKMSDETEVEKLDAVLRNRVIDDVVKLSTPSAKYVRQDVLEVVHPSKLERFYECNRFTVRFKFSRGSKDVSVSDRGQLYYECIKHINNSLDDIGDRGEIWKKLYTLGIVGSINDKDYTYGTFFSHLTAEIESEGKKYFRIDGHWYFLKDEFLEVMSSEAMDYYTKYRLHQSFLNAWNDGDDEDKYNLSHTTSGFYVLDKVLDGNIEMCDILYVTKDRVFLIHVKDGFDAKMRDLHIQLVLSAKRVANDLKNREGSTYIKKTLEKYNSENPTNKMDVNAIIDGMKNKSLSTTFVMAFRNQTRKGLSSSEKISQSRSNIAKYSLVQTVKEMQRLDFDVRLIDISEL